MSKSKSKTKSVRDLVRWQVARELRHRASGHFRHAAVLMSNILESDTPSSVVARVRALRPFHEGIEVERIAFSLENGENVS